jgi:phage recombination protein Bet
MTMQVCETNPVSNYQFDNEQLRIIKETVCKGATNEELAFFLQVCKRLELDPFSKQVYSVPRGGQRTIQVGIDGLRLIADRSGKYIPGKEATYTYDKSGALFSATAYVKKQARDGSWHEVSATAFWEEYNAGQGLWKKMPHVMLAKCAESAALRKAFPAEMCGLYSEEEMHQADATIKTSYTTPLETTLPSIENKVVTREQAEDLKNLHEQCEHEFKQSVFKNLTESKIAGWTRVPANRYNDLRDAALANIEKYKAEVNAELTAVNE